MNRNTFAAAASTLLVIVVVILGFRSLGGPSKQRLVQADLRIVRSVASLAQQVNMKWRQSSKVLPADLSAFPTTATQEPVTHQAISYRRKSDEQYELCAVFSAASQDDSTQGPNDSNNFWSHPKGEHCFDFDASQSVPIAPYIY
jgi:hypothetical protein